MERRVSPWVWYLIGAFWLSWLVQALLLPSLGPKELSYTEFKAAVAADQVKEVQVASGTVRGTYLPEGEKEPSAFTTVRIDDPDLLRDLEEHGVKATGVPVSSFFQDALSWILPLVVFGLVWIFLLRRIGGQGQAGFMQIGQSKARIYVEKDVKVTFADVAGVDEAKGELQEVIRYLKEPERFTRLGGTIPKGILLVGPPGTGKTLLARAVAGESGVPFFSISGSEFVEMFVGVGAARVRDLFQQARSKAPCIIFVDELDALGKARGVGPMVHEEREQTLNQLLVELDGFDARTGVILMAATNRPEVLDPALLRAGRFDRHVLVDRPDKPGRLAILKVHGARVALSPQVNLEEIAAMTAGFVGADLANLVNEAALLAVRRDHGDVSQADLREAVERVIAGLEKKNRVLNPEEKRRVAHHEIGHALVALSIPGADAVQKISIIPRGIAALGYTLQLPTEDRFLMTESELLGRIAVLLGGRVAEEIVFGDVSTGAQDDLRKATEIARSMVVSYGMSHKIGEVSLAGQEQQFLTPGQRSRGEYSEATAREIDTEIRRLIDEQRQRVERTLRDREPLLRRAAEVLLEKETITGEELASLVAGQHEAVAG